MARLVKTGETSVDAPGSAPWEADLLLTALDLDEIGRGGAAALETILPPGIPVHLRIKKALA